MQSVIILSLCLRWQPSIRAPAVPEVMELSDLLYSLVTGHVSALELKKGGKARDGNEFSPPCWWNVRDYSRLEASTRAPYHLLIEIQWGVKEAFKKNSQSTGPSCTATTRESNLILTSLPLVKDPSLPIMAWDWVSRRASVCSSKSTLNHCYTDRIYAKSRDPH